MPQSANARQRCLVISFASRSRPDPGERESVFANLFGKQVESLDYLDDPDLP